MLTRTGQATGRPPRYTWTAEHQLLGIAYPDGTARSLRYDPLGRRVEIDDGAPSPATRSTAGTIVAEYDAANALVATYVSRPGTPNTRARDERGGQRYFYLTDAQGSTTALTTLAGDVADQLHVQRVRPPSQTGDWPTRSPTPDRSTNRRPG